MMFPLSFAKSQASNYFPTDASRRFSSHFRRRVVRNYPRHRWGEWCDIKNTSSHDARLPQGKLVLDSVPERKRGTGPVFRAPPATLTPPRFLPSHTVKLMSFIYLRAGTPTIMVEGSGLDMDSISVVSSVAPPHIYQCKCPKINH